MFSLLKSKLEKIIRSCKKKPKPVCNCLWCRNTDLKFHKL